MALTVPELLAASCRRSPKRAAWLERLPDTIRDLERRWSLTVDAPFDGKEATASWVAPAVLADRTSAVLKVGMPHMEAEQEISGLRFWDGDPTVRVIEADDGLGAMLLERAEPGTLLRESPESEQDGRDYSRIRIVRYVVSPSCSVWTTSVSDCGRSRGLRPLRGPVGRTRAR